MTTSDIIDIIFENAEINAESFEGPYRSIKKQLRYYRDDIPARPRYLFDADAVYFYNIDACISNIKVEADRRDLAERGDIMTSIWAPLTYYLKLNNGTIINKNNANIDKILENYMTEDVLRLFGYLSEQYASRGNLLLLPNAKNSHGKRKLNADKFAVSEDKVDQFLFFCLNGQLIEYFDHNIENVRNWIISERLECLFSKTFFQNPLSEIEAGAVSVEVESDDMDKENLQSLIDEPQRIETYKYSMFQENDWKTYFERLSKVIAYRNSVVIEPHIPFTWK